MVWWLKFSLCVCFIALVFLPFFIYVRTGSIYNKMFSIVPRLLCLLCDWFFPGKKNLTKKKSRRKKKKLSRLRAELSCRICMKLCFEPSTTPCGHSFCRKCLRSICGKKCPKCRELISNGQPLNLDTILWNTIQILFPQEIEERKAASAKQNIRQETRSLSSVASVSTNVVHGSRIVCSTRNEARRRGGQDEETDFALRLKIERSLRKLFDVEDRCSRATHLPHHLY